MLDHHPRHLFRWCPPFLPHQWHILCGVRHICAMWPLNKQYLHCISSFLGHARASCLVLPHAQHLLPNICSLSIASCMLGFSVSWICIPLICSKILMMRSLVACLVMWVPSLGSSTFLSRVASSTMIRLAMFWSRISEMSLWYASGFLYVLIGGVTQ